MRFVFPTLGILLVLGLAPVRAEQEALFIGNSFTFGGGNSTLKAAGGVPKMVAAIAESKGRALGTKMLAVGGKDWGFHLQQPATRPALGEKKWDWVVLQDYSTKPTHLGSMAEFLQNGETLYRAARQDAPQAKVVLYETWARGKGDGLYGPSKKQFADPQQMTAELVQGYETLAQKLEAIDPGTQVEIAPVGKAFALWTEKYPDQNIYAKDTHHANAQGSYLAALVLYATLFQDTPTGATDKPLGIAIEPKMAGQMQEVAAEVTKAGR